MVSAQFELYRNAIRREAERFLETRGVDCAQPGRKIVDGKGNRYDLFNWVLGEKRVLVSAEPGAGKSVTVNQLIRKYASLIAAASFIPLYQINNRMFEDPRSFEAWLKRTEAGREHPEGVEESLRDKNTLFVVDGLDEIADDCTRTLCGYWTKKLEETFPCQFLTMSTRPWVTHPQLRSYAKCTLAPLTKEEMQAMFRHQIRKACFRFDEDEKRARAREAFKSFEDNWETYRGFQDLLRNPSYLQLAISILTREPALPRRAAEFLKEGIEAFLESIQMQEAAAREGVRIVREDTQQSVGQLTTNAKPLLEEVGYRLHNQGSRVIELADLLTLESWGKIGQYRDAWATKLELTDEEKTAVIKYLAEHAPFFGMSHKEGGKEFYYLTHLGLQEYFAGGYLSREIREKGEVAIEQRIGNHWWRQPIIYALAREMNQARTDAAYDAVKRRGDESMHVEVARFIRDENLSPDNAREVYKIRREKIAIEPELQA